MAGEHSREAARLQRNDFLQAPGSTSEHRQAGRAEARDMRSRAEGDREDRTSVGMTRSTRGGARTHCIVLASLRSSPESRETPGPAGGGCRWGRTSGSSLRSHAAGGGWPSHSRRPRETATHGAVSRRMPKTAPRHQLARIPRRHRARRRPSATPRLSATQCLGTPGRAGAPRSGAARRQGSVLMRLMVLARERCACTALRRSP